MSIDTIFSINTTSSDQTAKVALVLATILKPGRTIELVGDLGAGKTTFARALISGLGFMGQVPSPTFALSRRYKVDNDLFVDHFDLYRLHGHDIVTDELDESIADPSTYTLVEWANHGAAQLPEDRVEVRLDYGTSDSDRTIQITGDSATISKLKKVLQ